MPHDVPTIPISRWGKDHWSTLAYLETRAVDGVENGIAVPNRDQMRTDPDHHPHLVGPRVSQVFGCSEKKYPTRLAGGEEQQGHDDWDCLDDAVSEGLLEDVGTGLNRAYRFTPLGLRVAAKLRRHKAQGGNFSNFVAGP